MDWPTALAICLPPFAALAGVAVGALMSRSTQREALAFEARRARLEKLGAAVGEAKALLVDAEPQRLSMNFHPERSATLVKEVDERWQSIRPVLLGAALLNDSAEVRAALSELASDIRNLLHANAWIVSDLNSKSELGRDSIATGRENYEAAIRSLDKTAILLRSSDPYRRNDTGRSGAKPPNRSGEVNFD